MGDAVLEAIERDEAYRVVSVLADGPSGRTELVAPVATGTPIYVRKRIPIQIANPEAWEQLAAISHPLLPHVVETYLLPDTFVTVCDYVEGFSVEQLMAARGRIDADQVRAIIADVCAAAGALHARGIIHRDISPKNVVIAADGAHLIDLGIARVGDATARHDTTRLGTWGFAAPEQFGFAQTDARSDVYSIGTLAGYMLTGTDPGEYGFDVAVSNLPWNLSSVIERARSFEPSARFASARELSQAFDNDALARRDGESLLDSVRHFVRALIVHPEELRIAWRESTLLKKIAFSVALFCWLALCGGMYSTVADIDPAAPSGWVVVDILMKLLISTCFMWMGADALFALIGAGPYRKRHKRGALWLKRMLPVFAITIAITFVVTLIATELFGNYQRP